MNRRRKIILGLVSGLLLIGTALAVRIATFPETLHAGRYNCAIVLGAAVQNDRPSPVFQARIDHAIDLQKAGVVSHLIFTGGTGPGDALAESEAGRKAALNAGIAADKILIEKLSKTTLQNLQQALPLYRASGFKNAVIVSDPLHLYRACLMAKDIGIDATGSAAPHSRYSTWATKGPFLLREVYFTIHYFLLGQ